MTSVCGDDSSRKPKLPCLPFSSSFTLAVAIVLGLTSFNAPSVPRPPPGCRRRTVSHIGRDDHYHGVLAAVPLFTDLVENGGGESVSLSPWEEVPKGGVQLQSDTIRGNQGTYYFSGVAMKLATLVQRFDLTSDAAAIDAGTRAVWFAGALGGYSGQTDAATLTVKFFEDVNRSLFLGGHSTFEVTPRGRDFVTQLVPRNATACLPPKTRLLQLELVFARDGTTGSNDGYADAVAMAIFPVSKFDQSGRAGVNVIRDSSPPLEPLSPLLSNQSFPVVTDCRSWLPHIGSVAANTTALYYYATRAMSYVGLAYQRFYLDSDTRANLIRLHERKPRSWLALLPAVHQITITTELGGTTKQSDTAQIDVAFFSCDAVAASSAVLSPLRTYSTSPVTVDDRKAETVRLRRTFTGCLTHDVCYFDVYMRFQAATAINATTATNSWAAIANVTVTYFERLAPSVAGFNLVVNPDCSPDVDMSCTWSNVAGYSSFVPDALKRTWCIPGLGSQSWMQQLVNLSAVAPTLALPTSYLEFSASLGGYSSQEDYATITFELFDGGFNLLRTHTLDAPTVAERQGATCVVPRIARNCRLGEDGEVRFVRVNAHSFLLAGTASDGYVARISVAAKTLPPMGQLTPDNLILNGDATLGSAAPDVNGSLFGWTVVTGDFEVANDPYLKPYQPDSCKPAASPNWFFSGLRSLKVTVQQTVPLTNYATSIDSGSQAAYLRVWIGGYLGQLDYITVTFSFENARNVSLKNVTLGPQTPADRQFVTTFQEFARPEELIPPLTRRCVVSFTCERVEGKNCDGFVDDLVFKLVDPRRFTVPPLQRTADRAELVVLSFPRHTAPSSIANKLRCPSNVTIGFSRTSGSSCWTATFPAGVTTQPYDPRWATIALPPGQPPSNGNSIPAAHLPTAGSGLLFAVPASTQSVIYQFISLQTRLDWIDAGAQDAVVTAWLGAVSGHPSPTVELTFVNVSSDERDFDCDTTTSWQRRLRRIGTALTMTFSRVEMAAALFALLNVSSSTAASFAGQPLFQYGWLRTLVPVGARGACVALTLPAAGRASLIATSFIDTGIEFALLPDGGGVSPGTTAPLFPGGSSTTTAQRAVSALATTSDVSVVVHGGLVDDNGEARVTAGRANLNASRTVENATLWGWWWITESGHQAASKENDRTSRTPWTFLTQTVDLCDYRAAIDASSFALGIDWNGTEQASLTAWELALQFLSANGSTLMQTASLEPRDGNVNATKNASIMLLRIPQSARVLKVTSLSLRPRSGPLPTASGSGDDELMESPAVSGSQSRWHFPSVRLILLGKNGSIPGAFTDNDDASTPPRPEVRMVTEHFWQAASSAPPEFVLVDEDAENATLTTEWWAPGGNGTADARVESVLYEQNEATEEAEDGVTATLGGWRQWGNVRTTPRAAWPLTVALSISADGASYNRTVGKRALAVGAVRRTQGAAVGTLSAVAWRNLSITNATWYKDIDDERVPVAFEALLGGVGFDMDFATVTAMFLDTRGDELSRMTLGPLSACARYGVSGLWLLRAAAIVPATTRKVAVRIRLLHVDSPFNDAYVDNVKLWLLALRPQSFLPRTRTVTVSRETQYIITSETQASSTNGGVSTVVVATPPAVSQPPEITVTLPSSSSSAPVLSASSRQFDAVSTGPSTTMRNETTPPPPAVATTTTPTDVSVSSSSQMSGAASVMASPELTSTTMAAASTLGLFFGSMDAMSLGRAEATGRLLYFCHFVPSGRASQGEGLRETFFAPLRFPTSMLPVLAIGDAATVPGAYLRGTVVANVAVGCVVLPALLILASYVKAQLFTRQSTDRRGGEVMPSSPLRQAGLPGTAILIGGVVLRGTVYSATLLLASGESVIFGSVGIVYAASVLGFGIYCTSQLPRFVQSGAVRYLAATVMLRQLNIDVAPREREADPPAPKASHLHEATIAASRGHPMVGHVLLGTGMWSHHDHPVQGQHSVSN